MEKIYFEKRVLHILASNSFSGAENVACSIIETIDDYKSAYCSPDGQISNTLKKKAIEYLPVEKMNYKHIKAVVDSYQPDIIHAHDFKASILASRFNKRCKIVAHIHKNDPKMNKISLKSVLFRIASRKISKIMVVSDSVLNETAFKKYFSRKMVVIPNFVDKEKIIKKSKEYETKRQYDFFFFGRLSSEKNPLVFIEIIKRLNDKNIKAIMIGDGPLASDCRSLVKKYNLEENIEIISFLDNPFPYIRASKIGIMPSSFEGFGLSAVEAAILGKPVINSGVGGLAKIFNRTGLIANNIDECINIINSKKYALPNIGNYTDKKAWRNSIMEVYDECGN